MFSLYLAFQVLLMFDQRMYIQNKNLDNLVSKLRLQLLQDLKDLSLHYLQFP